ncbi:hypothetical protein [Sphingosinicella sp. BN140058]|uniref:hypothetical protein n=1 Tax=Sphingosinicella sp. BN140058 TaxID=1892855 RepID=UPI0010117AE5|nr:hypothetical protein [Sphingosinicella sp. BN140058]QAY77896.1 hypothetical protein ETR14_16245 [Sphingosinicella sp. BN140058]
MSGDTPELRSLAAAGAHQAVVGASELLRFNKEGQILDNSAYDPMVEPIEKLADALKIALEVERAIGDTSKPGNQLTGLDEEQGQLYAALCRYLDGWVG